MKLAVFSSKRYEREFLEDHQHLLTALPDLEIEYLVPRLDHTTAKLATGYDAVSIFVNDVVDALTIELLADAGVKCVLLRCAGFNQVDLEAAGKHGVIVLRVPAYSPFAIAEFAVALMLTTARKTHKAYNRTRESNFSLRGLMGFDIHGKTIGICGTGKIGRIFAKIMLGFGTRVIAYDIHPSDAAKKMGVEYVSFDEVMGQSDVISLHCPLLPTTRNMIDEAAVKKMKKGVLLVNTSRGELVNVDALLMGLRTKIISACGMDVVEGEEDLFFDDHTGEILENEKISMLLAMPNVVLTPHIAFCTDTAMTNIWSTTIQNAKEFCEKNGSEKLTNQVTLD